MPESKKEKIQESKKKTITVEKRFLQGDKPAIIFNKKGSKVLARAKKGIFLATTPKIVSLLKIKGYSEVKKFNDD